MNFLRESSAAVDEAFLSDDAAQACGVEVVVKRTVPPDMDQRVVAAERAAQPSPVSGDAQSASTVDPSRRRATMVFVRGAVVSLSVALAAGLLGVLYYIPSVARFMQGVGINLTSLRPIHTTFAAAFIFLAGIAVVHRYIEDIAGPMTKAEKLRTKAQVILWALAGLGIVLSLLARVFSGREYMGFHPIFSIPIAIGWVLFAWNAFGHFRKGFFSRPVFVTMWTVSLFFFFYTFAEQHAWLLGRVFSDPLLDMRLQWKATGTLVGSFNLLVYGSLYYIGVKRTGDDSLVHSNLAYALFGIGLLNSFTNFGHHTYHLPQNHVVKWISFVISMLEIIILARVVWDIAGSMRHQESQTTPNTERNTLDSTGLFMEAARWWTAWILLTALVISVPPLNAIIHGTTAVMGHAMGAEIGIDSMILFAALTWVVRDQAVQRGIVLRQLDGTRFKRTIVGLNVSVGVMVGWLTLTGVVTGVSRYQGRGLPDWLNVASHPVLVVCGIAAAYFLGRVLIVLATSAFGRAWAQSDEKPDTHQIVQQ